MEDIAKFDGKQRNKIYVGLYGTVFDVTSSPNFKDGGSYEKFAGHDISIACAHYSTDDKFLGQRFDKNSHTLKED